MVCAAPYCGASRRNFWLRFAQLSIAKSLKLGNFVVVTE
jgi:hypothetical protein